MSPTGTVIEEECAVENNQTSSRASSRSCSISSAPQKKKRKGSDDIVLGQVSTTLESISKQLGGSNETPQLERTANQCFGDYVVSKMDKINVEEIRDTAEADIIAILNNTLKECRRVQLYYIYNCCIEFAINRKDYKWFSFFFPTFGINKLTAIKKTALFSQVTNILL